MGSAKSREEIWQEWKALVNMPPRALERWLATARSASVGDTGDSGSTGRASGRRILEIRRRRKDELSADDWAHMARVVGYIRRHCAQVPGKEPVRSSDWRASLMNWGHDPLGRGGCACGRGD